MLDNPGTSMGACDGSRRRKLVRRITATVLFGACLLNSHSLGVVAAQGLKLTGATNFRDIGGYPVDGGHKIKSGVIFRSGELSGLTEIDQQTLAALNIRYEIDLRRDAERSAAPSHWGKEAPQVVWISIDPARNGDARKRQLSELHSSAQAKTLLRQATATIAIDGAAAIGNVFGELAKGSAPALIHCTAGKDRTGVTIAVLMTLLGASREDIYHEYMLSNESVYEQLQRQKSREQSGKDAYRLSGLDPDVIKTVMGTDPSYLDAMFDKINAKYGSFDAYRRDGLGITSAQVAQLRQNLIEQ